MAPPKLFGVEIPFVTHLGFEMVKMEGGFSELRYLPKHEHLNSFLVTHGGAIMTLLDVTLATAARSIDLETGVVTIEMKTSFMAPGRGALTARGTTVHRTTTMVFCEGEIVDADGKTVARGSGTFKYIRRMPPQRPGETDTGADG